MALRGRRCPGLPGQMEGRGQEVKRLLHGSLLGKVRKLRLGPRLYSVIHTGARVTACPRGLHFKEKLQCVRGRQRTD